MGQRGDLRAFYKGPKATFSLEFFPPRQDPGLVITKDVIARCAKFPVDFMTITYGAGGTTQEHTAALLSYVHSDLVKPVISHLTCVGHSVQEIDQILDRLEAMGIQYILALRGDPPAGSGTFIPHPEGFSCARDLIAHISKRGTFAIAAAGYPETHKDAQSPASDINYLKSKVDAGAEVIFTQLFFDVSMYLRFVERAHGVGITVPIVPGIMPIRDVAQLKRFTELCGASIPQPILAKLESLKDDKEGVIEYGIEVAHTLCTKLIEGGAPGIHLYTLNKAEQIYRLLSEITAPDRSPRGGSSVK